MKLYLEDEKGIRHEIGKITGIQPGDIVLLTRMTARQKDIELTEEYMSKKFCRKVIILDGRFTDIMIIPPIQKS